MQDWQRILANTIDDPNTLLRELALDPTDLGALFTPDFKLRVPRGFVDRMEKGNPQDPLLLQVLPLNQELNVHPGYSHDPVGEQHVNPIPGLLHKYHGRVLLTLTGGCAINCRYCFRRHFPYHDNTPGTAGWQQALDYIAKDHTIGEVILSGGDPLMLKDQQLSALVARLETIQHVKRLRIHTRFPIVIPERVNDELTDWLGKTRLKTIVVLHANHPNEINQAVIDALQRLHQANVTLFNQTVLLKNINDNAACLAKLSHALFTAHVIPYYLHLFDRVQGAAHFEVSERTARHLVDTMTQQLPGYLVPKLVREVAGERSKVRVL